MKACRVLGAMAGVALFMLVGCRAEPEMGAPRAEVGVFFGGQMQRVRRVEVPPVRPPKIGFRVEVPEGASAEFSQTPISYEIVRPGPEGRRVTEKGDLSLAPGQSRIDHVISFKSHQRLGVWNVRVLAGEEILADRALYLVPGSAPTP